jgi:hypothetical protein
MYTTRTVKVISSTLYEKFDNTWEDRHGKEDRDNMGDRNTGEGEKEGETEIER